MPLDAPAAVRPNIVASLIVESAPSDVVASDNLASSGEPQSRVLIQLATVSVKDANPASTDPVYALGIPVSGSATWNEVGHLDLRATSLERTLFAGLSVLAMTRVREAGIQIGDPVLVSGADPWSLLLLQWAKLQGASPLLFVRQGPEALSHRASSFGVQLQWSDPTATDLARAIKLTHRGGGFAVVLDAIASEQSMTQALSALRDGGRYMLVGMSPQQRVLLNAYPDLHRRDLEMLSAAIPPVEADFGEMFRFSLKLADEGRLRLDGLLDPAYKWRVVSADPVR